MYTVFLEFLLYLIPAIPIVTLSTILVYLHTILPIKYTNCSLFHIPLLWKYKKYKSYYDCGLISIKSY